MAIDFYPYPGQVLMCRLEAGLRRVIVVSPKKFNNLGSCVVVPISKATPAPLPPLHVMFAPNQYYFLHRVQPSWAMCGRVHSVSLQRLDRLRLGTHYITPSISPQDLRLVRRAVARAAGIDIDVPG